MFVLDEGTILFVLLVVWDEGTIVFVLPVVLDEGAIVFVLLVVCDEGTIVFVLPVVLDEGGIVLGFRYLCSLLLTKTIAIQDQPRFHFLPPMFPKAPLATSSRLPVIPLQ